MGPALESCPFTALWPAGLPHFSEAATDTPRGQVGTSESAAETEPHPITHHPPHAGESAEATRLGKPTFLRPRDAGQDLLQALGPGRRPEGQQD